MTLDEIGRKYKTDKSSDHHDFLRFYERRLAGLRNKQLIIFEIGVYRGGSVKTWSEFFPHSKVVGLDIEPSCKEFEDKSIYIRVGDASNPKFLMDILKEFGEPDIVIDDGSHRWDHQISSFQILFPVLSPGGFYIMEDLDTSFDAHLEDAPFDGFSEISTFDYLVRMSRSLCGDAALKKEKHYDLFISENYLSVGTIEFARRTAIISKKIAPGGGSI